MMSSWFTEIAGKAEDLLNRVDQTAATALQIKSKKSSSFDGNATKRTSGGESYEIKYSDSKTYRSSRSSYGSDINYSVNGKKEKPSQISSSQMKKAESDDEKLIRFLNCKESLPTTWKNKPSSDILKNMDKDTIPEEKVENSPELNEINGGKADAAVQDLLTSCDPVIIEDSLLMASSTDSVTCVEIIPETEKESVTEDFIKAKKQAEHSKAEMMRMQKKLDHWNSHISANDKVVFELHEKEKDLLAALDAKDSQLAVLKVRLQEADQDLRSKTTIINDLKAENERIIRNHAEESMFQNRTVENLRDQLGHVESELIKSKEAHRLSQSESMQQRTRFEEEHRYLAENYTSLQKKWSDANEKNKDILLQMKHSNANLVTIQQEYNDYKQKAQRILQSKEKLIASLKEGSFDIDQIEQTEASSALLNAEIEGIKQERDFLKDELRQATELTESYKMEIHELEKIAQRDLSVTQDQMKSLTDRYETERVQKEEFQLLNNQLKEELQFVREDLSKTKASLTSRIQDREIEIEKLRRQLTAKSLSSVSQNELESRLHALTENLIQKQTVVESLSTEKNSLVLQLERLEQQLKETQRFGPEHHTFVGVSNIEPDRKSRAALFENSFDSPLTQRVKRVYGGIDALSIRLGVFFRRYPSTRVFVIIYMLLLHLWVMIVLLTYEPEVHNASYEMIKKQ